MNGSNDVIVSLTEHFSVCGRWPCSSGTCPGLQAGRDTHPPAPPSDEPAETLRGMEGGGGGRGMEGMEGGRDGGGEGWRGGGTEGMEEGRDGGTGEGGRTLVPHVRI